MKVETNHFLDHLEDNQYVHLNFMPDTIFVNNSTYERIRNADEADLPGILSELRQRTADNDLVNE